MNLNNGLFISCTILLFLSCTNTIEKKMPGNTGTVIVASDKDSLATPLDIPKGAVEDNFNGDGVKEVVWLVPPDLNSNAADCIGDCNRYLKFSNPAIPQIIVKQCIGGEPINHSDFNNDKTDEIDLLPQWFTSCWIDYQVYTLKINQWLHAVPDFSTYCSQREAGVIPIEKDRNQPDKVIIRYSEMTEDRIVLKEKSLTIQ